MDWGPRPRKTNRRFVPELRFRTNNHAGMPMVTLQCHLLYFERDAAPSSKFLNFFEHDRKNMEDIIAMLRGSGVVVCGVLSLIFIVMIDRGAFEMR